MGSGIPRGSEEGFSGVLSWLNNSDLQFCATRDKIISWFWRMLAEKGPLLLKLKIKFAFRCRPNYLPYLTVHSQGLDFAWKLPTQ